MEKLPKKHPLQPKHDAISKDFKALCKKHNITKGLLVTTENLNKETYTIMTCSTDALGTKASEKAMCVGFTELISITNGLDGKNAKDLVAWINNITKKTPDEKLAEKKEKLLSEADKKKLAAIRKRKHAFVKAGKLEEASNERLKEKKLLKLI